MSTHLAQHGRYDYVAINDRPDFTWPEGKRLAVYIGLNFEHFHFGSGYGPMLVPGRHEPDVLNYSWRDYGNRVGAWRMLSLFESLGLPAGLIVNAAIADYCPELIRAYRQKLSSELIAHGRTNSESQNEFDEAGEAALIAESRDRLISAFGERPVGWLGPWIAQSRATPDLLAEAGFIYHMDWAHDDQPIWMDTRGRGEILSVPYPQEINDIPAIVPHRIDHREFEARIVDQFDEMLFQSRRQSLVMGIALHPYISGQPFRLRALRRALEHIAAHRSQIWLTTPGAIAEHYSGLFSG
ncbi:polysaccharide deacetylase family protein [Salinisphaera sp. Q1T1-3]|uniref:polysaccharide deacetylase family protein n=1 Tax=Salinisphaera sp. Q1T1-3 TaxID=2321229 RepID=UPI000E70C428|nr:polysaccharide deacetylase family protein [Salinisphaera sp. Q1T1-3]RJS91359.1 polysaccharide deacetylase [Salinisphaera sp. Q1T1-3]